MSIADTLGRASGLTRVVHLLASELLRAQRSSLLVAQAVARLRARVAALALLLLGLLLMPRCCRA